jgi:putative heme-binding domain-containing protein
LDALDRRGTNLEDFVSRSDEELWTALRGLDPLFESARASAKDASVETSKRVDVLPLLARGFDRKEEDLEILEGLLSPHSPPALRSAAVEALSGLDRESIPETLLNDWKELSPDLRSAVLKSLLQKVEWIPPLLDRLESGAINQREIDAVYRQRLASHENDTIRGRAEKIFEQSVSASRAEVLGQFKEAAVLAGDPMSGSATFKKLCSTCHALGGMGKAVGPDLSSLTDKSPEALLVHVLDPNRNVDTQYLTYIAETYLGDTHSGLLLRESENSIALMESDGVEVELLRDDLEALRSSDLSFMPEGLEVGLAPQDFADLFAFIASGQRPRKVVEGNQPKVARPEPFRGEIWMMATDCEIYGETLTFEKNLENLGDWRSKNDRAVWTLEVTEQDQPMVLVVDYAALPQSEGNRYTVDVCGQRFGGTVESTGSLENYRRIPVGRLAPEAGTYKLSISPAGEIHGELFDLRAAALQPAWMHGG